MLVSVTDLSLGGLVCPWVRDVSAPGKFTSLCMDHRPTALSCCLLGLSSDAAEWGQSLGYEWVAYGFGCDFSFLSLLRVLYFPWLFTVGVESILMGCTSVEVFWLVGFRPVRSTVVSTHSTGCFGVGQGHCVLAQGMWDGL